MKGEVPPRLLVPPLKCFPDCRQPELRKVKNNIPTHTHSSPLLFLKEKEEEKKARRKDLSSSLPLCSIAIYCWRVWSKHHACHQVFTHHSVGG